MTTWPKERTGYFPSLLQGDTSCCSSDKMNETIFIPSLQHPQNLIFQRGRGGVQVGRARTRHGAVGVRACTPPKTFFIPTAKYREMSTRQGRASCRDGSTRALHGSRVPELSPVRMPVTPLMTVPHAYRCAPWPTQWLGCTIGGGRRDPELNCRAWRPRQHV